MEYRGVEYTVVRTIDKGWRWSVKSGDRDKVGTASKLEQAIFRAQRHIDDQLSRASKKEMDRDLLQEHLAQAERHAAEGRRHIEKQEALIAEMNQKGHDTTDARQILGTLREAQAIHEQDVERLLRELG